MTGSISEEESLENAVKMSTRLQPLFLCSKHNRKDTLALCLVSGEKVFFRSDLSPKYFGSVLVHEIAEISQNSLSPFKQIALALDLADTLHTKDSKIETKKVQISVPVSSLTHSLEESRWELYSDAGAIYSQLNSSLTPPEFRQMLLDELNTHNRDVLRAYLGLEEIVEKFRRRYRPLGVRPVPGQSKEQTARLRIKELVLALLLGTVRPRTLGQRFRIFGDISEEEIPEWSNAKTVIEYVDRELTDSGLDLAVGQNYLPLVGIFVLIPFMYLVIDEQLRHATKQLTIGVCHDYLSYHSMQTQSLPIVFYKSPDLKVPFLNRRRIHCWPPIVHGKPFSEIVRRRDADIKSLSLDPQLRRNDAEGSTLRTYSAELQMQNAVMIALLKAQSDASRKCANCSETLDCAFLDCFSTRLQEEFVRLGDLARCAGPALFPNRSGRVGFRLPLFRNCPPFVLGERARVNADEVRISQRSSSSKY